MAIWVAGVEPADDGDRSMSAPAAGGLRPDSVRQDLQVFGPSTNPGSRPCHYQHSTHPLIQNAHIVTSARPAHSDSRPLGACRPPRCCGRVHPELGVVLRRGAGADATGSNRGTPQLLLASGYQQVGRSGSRTAEHERCAERRRGAAVPGQKGVPVSILVFRASERRVQRPRQRGEAERSELQREFWSSSFPSSSHMSLPPSSPPVQIFTLEWSRQSMRNASLTGMRGRRSSRHVQTASARTSAYECPNLLSPLCDLMVTRAAHCY